MKKLAELMFLFLVAEKHIDLHPDKVILVRCGSEVDHYMASAAAVASSRREALAMSIPVRSDTCTLLVNPCLSTAVLFCRYGP